MFYHVLVSTSETGELYSFDNKSLDRIISDVVKPYIAKRVFQFNGFFVHPSKVKRLRITRTDSTSEYYQKLAYDELPDNTFMVIKTEDVVLLNGSYFTDITVETIEQVRSEMATETGTTALSPSERQIGPEATHSTTIIKIGQMVNSQFQYDTTGSSQTQMIETKGFDEEVKELLESLRDKIYEVEISPIKRTEMVADIDTMQSQLTSPKPKYSIVRECMLSLKTILEGAAGGIIAGGFLPQVLHVLGQIPH